jgi:hypothetical protein
MQKIRPVIPTPKTKPTSAVCDGAIYSPSQTWSGPSKRKCPTLTSGVWVIGAERNGSR